MTDHLVPELSHAQAAYLDMFLVWAAYDRQNVASVLLSYIKYSSAPNDQFRVFLAVMPLAFGHNTAGWADRPDAIRTLRWLRTVVMFDAVNMPTDGCRAWLPKAPEVEVLIKWR